MKASRAIAPAIVVVLASTCFAQGLDGLSQVIDPSSPRGDAVVTGSGAASGAWQKLAAAPRAGQLGTTVLGGAFAAPTVQPKTRGAYFRKVTSAASPDNLGLVATGRLPVVYLDQSRWHTPAAAVGKAAKEGDYTGGPLDRPSVYLGGHAGGERDGRELDCGLSYDRVYDRDGNASEPPRYAFRPFWRVNNGKKGDGWHNPPTTLPANASPLSANTYFEPGEAIKMSLTTDPKNPNFVTLDIQSSDAEGKTKHFQQTFEADQFGVAGVAQSFKRINSIDQFKNVTDDAGRTIRKGNEGPTANVIPTTTMALGAEWSSVELETTHGDVPLTAANGATVVAGGDIAASYDSIFTVSPVNAQGGEAIAITPEAAAR